MVGTPGALHVAALAASAAVLILSACNRAPTLQHLDKNKVDVNTNAQLRTANIGRGRFVSLATFVLVDAINETGQDAAVTLGGVLVDHAGAKLSELRPESLFIPKGDKRTFALIDNNNTAQPTAVGASVVVRSAIVPTPSSLQVSQQRTYDDFGKLVLDGWVHNSSEHNGKVIVLATFYDANEVPLTRPNTLLPIGGGATRAVQFVGPPGATRAVMYLGDQVWD
ncbi:MAG: hypothetical protein KBG15_03995 [Kofleriaceae bacterium]|nr:hypothetical protein [Kofleriaceae bacterium]